MTKRFSRAHWLIGTLLLQTGFVACGGDSGQGGGTATVGGSSNAGPSVGGSSAAGKGGSASIGGNVGLGGATTATSGTTVNVTGGTSNVGSGGATTVTSIGGTTAASGGQPATGGTTAKVTAVSGGTTSTGGTTAKVITFSGGTTSTGGTTAKVTTVSGGTTSAGGSTAKGGTTNSGGTTASPTGGTTGSSKVGTGAPESKPLGYGQATTGGGNATSVAVATLAAAQAAIDAYSGTGGLVLNYTGTFNFASITDPCTQWKLDAQTLEIKNKNNITILGADGSAANFGIHIASASSNIIVRNMTMGLTPGGDASDIISIEGMSGGFPTNIWIDHNTLFTALVACAGAGDVSFDGMIDVKKGADNVTISYNHLHDHHKVSLNGFSDSDTATRHITFHHNLFENVGSRTPLQRGGYSHMLNNYLLNVETSGMNIRMSGYSLIEANYFEKVKDPVTSRDSSAIGYWDLRANNLATAADVATGNAFGITWDAGSSGTVNATDWKTTAAYPVALGYSYTAQPFQCIHDGLRAAVGAGKKLATLTCN